eukprot:TRINITY_DN31496_c0_g1_i1.p1 TRINITY_DN31496_c0_g1~~TRINITY_DN31496_c0_g1_i1.p1  ORF type:complete len:114 (-),score=8.78 TRINITY_DN31496_c0_g1_i1:126-467(-)
MFFPRRLPPKPLRRQSGNSRGVILYSDRNPSFFVASPRPPGVFFFRAPARIAGKGSGALRHVEGFKPSRVRYCADSTVGCGFFQILFFGVDCRNDLVIDPVFSIRIELGTRAE